MTRIIIILLAVLVLAGCDQKALFDAVVPKDEVEFAKNYFALFQARDFDAIEAKNDPINAPSRAQLEQVASFFAEKPTDIQTVGFQTFSNGEKTQVNLTFQYEYPKKWLLANIVLQKQGNQTVVTGVRVRPLRDSLENINRFTFEGKGVTHFTILAAAIIVPLLIITALILCIKTPIPKRKWLWILFILLGFVQVTLNWTDGKVNINPISFQLLGSGFWKAIPFGPVLITVSFPIGAIVFLIRRKKLLAQATQDQQRVQGDVGG